MEKWRSTRARPKWDSMSYPAFSWKIIVREQVLLQLDAKVSGEACKGICPICGANRNETNCFS